jgi:hypothetical protein
VLRQHSYIPCPGKFANCKLTQVQQYLLLFHHQTSWPILFLPSAFWMGAKHKVTGPTQLQRIHREFSKGTIESLLSWLHSCQEWFLKKSSWEVPIELCYWTPLSSYSHAWWERGHWCQGLNSEYSLWKGNLGLTAYFGILYLLNLKYLTSFFIPILTSSHSSSLIHMKLV